MKTAIGSMYHTAIYNSVANHNNGAAEMLFTIPDNAQGGFLAGAFITAIIGILGAVVLLHYSK